MVEPPLFKVPTLTLCLPTVPGAARAAIDELLPHGGSLQEKLNRNGMSCTSPGVVGDTGLFLNMSRVNLQCLGNADHQYLENRGVKILVASRDLQKGEEVSISYTDYMPREERRNKLLCNYGFLCHCSVCEDNSLEDKLARAKELDEAILQLGRLGKIEQALLKGRSLLRIYDELSFSSWLYQRTLYDMFQVAITKQKYVKDGRKYIRQAYEAVLAYTGDNQFPEVQRFQRLVDFPQEHRNYLLLK